jgi:protein kinase-like protein
LLGQTLSHDRITAALGVGGMGEVYRATDTTLGRDVAIKVLPAEVARDPERLARFRREAQLLASLNHPNIAAIYGLEEQDGKPFLALELVEGKDLKERLETGAIPVEEALEIAERIAEALEEAHGSEGRRGVCTIPSQDFTGATWNAGGMIVFSLGGPHARLYTVPATGGEAKPLTSLDESRGETGHWWPQFLPDGRHILAQVGSAKEENAGLHVLSVDALPADGASSRTRSVSSTLRPGTSSPSTRGS